MKPGILIVIGIVSVVAIAAVTIGTIEYQSMYNYNCNSDGGYVTGFLSCTRVNEDFSDPRITGKMAREICSITGGECPPNYPANVLDDGSQMVGVTIWNAETNSEKSYVFTIVNNTLSYELHQGTFDLSQITLMRPNSMEFFYYPNPEDTENRDVFQKFILIRLPEHLGGDADDSSAFRAYSAVSLSDHCLVKYWPENGRQRMENPCWGDLYRATDGVLMAAVDSGRVAFSPNALPYLELTTDHRGSLFVEPPVWTLDRNGVIGVGRHVSMEQVRQGSQMLIDSVMKSHPNYPQIPVTFGAYTLTQIHFSNDVEVMYLDFSPVSDYLYLEIDNVSAEDQQAFRNLALSDSKVWQIDNTPIKIDGSGFDKDQTVPYFKQYKATFILDGFTFVIEGKDLEMIKRGIVTHFFPENDYDDLILASMVEK